MADAHAKQHDYHLVDPSPWPIVGSVSAFVLAIGAITWMHHLFALAPLIFGIGIWLAASVRVSQGRERQALIARRDSLLGELTQLEARRRDGAIGQERYESRRHRLITQLEQIYGELDEVSAGPQGGGEGVAA